MGPLRSISRSAHRGDRIVTMLTYTYRPATG
jgi:hypothetical protein